MKQKKPQDGRLQKTVRVLLLLLLDTVLINLAQFLALYVRYEFQLQLLYDSGYLRHVQLFTPVYTVMALAIFAKAGIYNSLWMFASVKEAVHIGLASMVTGVLQFFFMTVVNLPVPRSFPFLNILFLAVFIIGERFAYRAMRQSLRNHGHHGKRARTMLIGAGAAGAMVLRDLNDSEMSHNQVVCFIDDDPQKQGRKINGVPIVGSRNDIQRMVSEYNISEIILTIPTCSSEQRREILERCQQTGCVTKILPGLAELASENPEERKIRKVEIEDLLGRDSVKVDLKEIKSHILNRTVLVTGGGGSIGSELCRQIAARNPGHLIIFDIYENNAYDIQQELRRKYPALQLTVLIGSVRDKARVDMLFRKYRPDIIYHAAAHKHVPLMEDSPNEAVKNNIFGTYHVADASDRYGAKTFVLISTDKAVNPTNVMGATKRVCEMIIQMFSRKSATRFVAVRFGNVLGSNGSVIPLFRRQIEHGGPVTVTHKEIIRYFMTIPEAVSLVLQAGVYANGGEIFILDMGNPVKIDDLARKMIRLSGFEPDKDIKIVYTGLRPGEKLFEELLLKEEGLEKTANDLIFVGHPNGFSDAELQKSLQRFETLCQENSPAVVEELSKLVKTFHRETAASGI